MNIYVSNLGFNVTDQALKQLFAAHGEVSSAKIITDKFTNESRGFGFVEMQDDSAANQAIEAINGSSVEGRTVKAMEARPREERSNNNSPRRY